MDSINLRAEQSLTKAPAEGDVPYTKINDDLFSVLKIDRCQFSCTGRSRI